MNNLYRIAVADDHVHVRRELIQFLQEENGLKIIGEAGDGIELLEFLSGLSAPKNQMVDMVILDISMPRLGGIETSRKMRKAYPAVKILFLSSYDNKGYFDYAINGGADGYLLKEDMGTELLSAIRSIQQGSFYLSPGLRRSD